MTTTMKPTNATSTLTMAEVRMLVRELNSDRERIARSLSLAAELPANDAAGTVERSQVRYEAVVAALERVADGTYGICTQCGESIPFGRLLVMPEVTHCVACHRA